MSASVEVRAVSTRDDLRLTHSLWSRVCSWLLPVDEWAERFQYVHARWHALTADDQRFVDIVSARLDEGLRISRQQKRRIYDLSSALFAAEER